MLSDEDIIKELMNNCKDALNEFTELYYEDERFNYLNNIDDEKENKIILSMKEQIDKDEQYILKEHYKIVLEIIEGNGLSDIFDSECDFDIRQVYLEMLGANYLIFDLNENLEVEFIGIYHEFESGSQNRIRLDMVDILGVIA